VTGLPFTFAVDGPGVWFFRDGKRINRKLTRTQLEEAISRCPLSTTTEIKDLMDYAYLFAVLRDGRIGDQASRTTPSGRRAWSRTDLFVTNDSQLSGLVVPGVTFITGIARIPY
jgi:hypothetical protein